MRKLALVGLVLCVGRGSIAQLSAAIVLSFAFFSLQMKTWPYKIEQDNLFRASTEAHVFIVIMVALVLKNDLRWEMMGIEAYDMILFISFIALVPMAGLLAVFSKLKYVQDVLNKPRSTTSAKDRRALAFDLQALGLATDSDRQVLKRYIDGWHVNKEYAAFLSHYKLEAAAEARIMKVELVRMMRCQESQVFLDADNLTDLRDLLQNVADSDCLVLLHTQGVLSRPWCLLELHAAATHHVPIVVVRVSNAFAGHTEMAKVLGDLGAYLAKENPQAIETLKEFDLDPSTVAKEILAGLKLSSSPEQRLLADPENIDSEDEVILFDTHQSSTILEAQIVHLATAMVKYVCPENEDLLPEVQEEELESWPVLRQYAVLIIHEEQSPVVVQKAEELRQWLVEHTPLTGEQVAVQIDIQNTRSRQLNDVQPADLEVVSDVDCVLLLQSAKVMQEPRCVTRLYAAITHRVPIVCAVLMKSSHSLGLRPEHDALVYDFTTAKPMMEDMPAHVAAEATHNIASATGTPTKAVGLALSLVLPNIISKPFGLEASEGEIDGQMREIERTLRRSSASGAGTADSSSSIHTPRQVRPEANRDANLSSMQVAQLRAAFDRVDANSDGGITRDEIMGAIRRDPDLGELLGLHGHSGDEQVFEAGRVFQSMDTDGDHSIDVDEFVAFFGKALYTENTDADMAEEGMLEDWKVERKAELAAELGRIRNGQPRDETLLPDSSSSEENEGARP